MTQNLAAFWLTHNDQRYWVELDRERTLISASISIAAHDKRPTLRRVVNGVTLARLQAVVRPSACPVCGSEK